MNGVLTHHNINLSHLIKGCREAIITINYLVAQRDGSVEISFLTGFKSLIMSYIFHHFYTVSFPPLCNCRDIVMVLIRRIIQSSVESSPELLHAVAASASVWGEAACRSLNSQPPVLWAPALDDPLRWDQQSCWTPGSTSQVPLQCHPHRTHQNPAHFGLNGPIHTQPGEPRALHSGSIIKVWSPITASFCVWLLPWPP